MNTGIQDAFNLGWKLAWVSKGRSDPKILQTYQTERHPVAEMVIQTTDRMFDVMVGTNPFIRFARNHILPHLMPVLSKVAGSKMAEFISEINIRYRKSALSGEQPEAMGKFLLGGPKAGDRFPGLTFRTGKQNKKIQILTLLQSGEHILLVFPDGKDKEPSWTAWLDKAAHEWKGWVQFYGVVPGGTLTAEGKSPANLWVDPDGESISRLGAEEGGVYLIRPDGYIGYRSANLDPEGVASYLRSHYQL